MKNILAAVCMAVLCCACGLPRPISNTQAAGTQNATGQYSSTSVGENEEVPAAKMGYKRAIEPILEEFRRPGLKSSTEFPIAWKASSAQMNGHVLKTFSRALVIANANVYGVFLEIIAYDPQPDQDGTIWVDKAAAYYKKAANGDKTKYAVNGNFILVFETAHPGNQGYIDIFKKAKLK